ncbi:hypothetical protein [Neorhizobium alkalisoli]|jgi:hypothetical protein|uniref:hypothetical protein n=1 Tax=Neorhizobium alkalisoli TaxID=528178 RepID=UPI0011A1F200|nr:hypothetical protein [Neorhizobium alkalisoli]
MPFYLVTHTLLVEAENEHDAAETGAAQLRSGAKITVSVKSDETTITHITVAATVAEPPPVSCPIAEADDQAHAVQPEAVVATPTDRKLILRRMMADAVMLFRPRT